LRVTGGEGRGRLLHGPGDLRIRPTSDRVRGALFDLLGPRVAGASFLDLCAGTGAVGIEALSRGAKRVVFVDRDRRAIALIRKNLDRVRPPGEAELIEAEIEGAVASFKDAGGSFAVVFIDPPYDAPDQSDLLASAARVVAQGGILVLEHRTRVGSPSPISAPGCRPLRDYRHGDTTLTTFLLEPGTA